MNFRSLRLASWAAAGLVAIMGTCMGAGCGGAPAAPQAPASSAAPIASAVMPAPPDLGPVAAPPGLVVTGTVGKLGGSLATVGSWIQLPMPQSEQVTEALTGQPLGALVDLDQPIHLAVAVSGSGMRLQPLIGVSAGIRDVDAAKAALAQRYKLVPGDDGALIIQSLGHPPRGSDTPDDDRASDDEDPRAGEIAPAYGAPAMRLVCGWDAKSLAALGPWLTRGATRDRPPSADAHLELHMAALKPTIAAERKLLGVLLGSMLGGTPGGHGTGIRELLTAVANDVADFGNDLDTATLDLALSDPGAAATLTLNMSGAASTIARLATANADRNGPPPAAFWQMPGDADFAVFDRGVDPNAVARGRDLVLKVVTDALADDGVKDADRHALTDALGKLVSPAPMVFASGVDADVVRKTLAALKALPDSADKAQAAEATRVATQALLGWRILEADEPAATRIDAMKALVKASTGASVVAAYGKAADGWVHLKSAPMPKGVTLAAGAQRFTIEVPLVESAAHGASAKKPALPKPVAVDVFIVPDAARSWIGFGGDPALVASKLAAAMGGTGDGLRARPELAGFKDQALGAGGFLTGRGVAEMGEQIAALAGGDAGGFVNGGDIFESAAQAPHQGTTPILFSLTAPPAAAGAPATQTSAVMTVQLPRATVDDILVVALKHGF
jgi:hypothetical protein